MRVVSVFLLGLFGILLTGDAFAQATIRGTVTDSQTGETLPGANIFLPSINQGTASDLEGQYAIADVPAGTYQLVARFVGFKEFTQQVTVPSSGTVTVDIAMETDYLNLDEMVVIGYGTQQRRVISGAVASLEPDALLEVPTPSIETALQGRLAGVHVSQNSGNPGAAPSVRIRGASSISAGNDPLYVIDGVPVTQGNFSQINIQFGGQDVSAIADLNFNEVESVEVLKDASAAAIYGSRASNGDVLITTKRGQVGRPVVNFSSYVGTQEAWNTVDFLDASEYIAVYNESIANDFGLEDYIGYRNDEVENAIEVEPGTNTNWVDEVLRSAPISSATLSISGGNERTRYFVSGTSFMQEGIVEGFGFERLNGRVNLDYSVNDRLSLGTNVSLARSLTTRSRGDNTIYGPFANALAVAPIYPVYDEDGGYFSTNYANPVGLYEENVGEERSVRILGNAFADYQLAYGLNARASFGLDNLSLRSRLYDSPIVGVATGSGGSGTTGNAFVNKLTFEGTLNFVRNLNTVHALSGVAGASYEDNSSETSSVTGTNFPSERFQYLTSAATITGGTSAVTDWALTSFFGRFGYTYDGRYSATVNVRADGSSRFGANNRYGVFPSASVSWRVSEEAFLQESTFLNELKLRASYGLTGNQFGIGDFDSRGLWIGGTNYGDQPGIAPNQLENPDLKWETTAQFDVGLDLSAFNERVSLSADYYIKNTDDLLLARPIPSTSGFATVTSNVGSMENRGVELAVRADLVRSAGRGFNWSTEFNVSTNENEVTKLVNDEPFNSGFASRVEVGEELGFFYGYVTDGIFRDEAEVEAHATQPGAQPGDIRFKDLNDDGAITADDRAKIGSPWPDYIGGFRNTFGVAGFDLSVFMQFSYGNDIFNGIRTYADAFGSGFDNNTTRALDRWTPDNPDATEPRATYNDPNANTRTSDRFIEDGSYLRVKNVVLGYNLPNRLIQQARLRSVRLYVQAQNLFTATDYSGFDPEVNYAGNANVTRGTDFYTLPQARSFTVGVNLGF